MREVLYNGPLDIVRRRIVEATELDEIAHDYIGMQLDRDVEPSIEVSKSDEVKIKQRYQEIWDTVIELDENHPLLGQSVAIYGDELTLSVEETGKPRPYALSVDRLCPAPEGIYAGHNLKRVYDPKTGTTTFRVVHMLKGVTDEFWDDFGKHHEITDHTYVCVTNSEIMPTQPLNAHSMEDIRKDKVVREFDAIAYDESLSKLQRLRDVGAFANSFLINQAQMPGINLQRVSYFNAVGLLDGITVVSNDVLILELAGGESIVTGASNLNQYIPLQPLYLQADVAYTREPDESQITFIDSKQLYVYSLMPDGRTAAAPLSNIVSIS